MARPPAARGSASPHGPGSLAPVGRRVVALLIDWALCWAVSLGFFGGNSWATLLIFLGENVLLVGTAGFTVGHRVLGLRVRRLVADAPDGPPGPLRALVRSVLVCLVVPAVVWDGDGRGLHDRAAGTAIVRR
ncbi:RDD family protein [Luteimicrobium album]|uniref:RDD family protein n=1 Tax=Luteimicrobium album TaxID=1054550 RepID=A0ABQ6I690_9MICO|nr:RDD family protein [Luteimicrobium album]